MWGDEKQRDVSHDRAEYQMDERLGEPRFLAAAMIECRPGDEGRPNLQPHCKGRQEDKRRNASEHPDANCQCCDEIHSVPSGEQYAT